MYYRCTIVATTTPGGYRASVGAGGLTQKNLTVVHRLGGVRRHWSSGNDRSTALMWARWPKVGGGTWRRWHQCGQGRQRSNAAMAAPIAGQRTPKVRGSSGGSDTGHYAAAAANRAHGEKFMDGVRRGEGVKALRLTDKCTATYIHWLTDKYSRLYSSVPRTFLGFSTDEYISVRFFGTEEYSPLLEKLRFFGSERAIVQLYSSVPRKKSRKVPYFSVVKVVIRCTL
jgi:hypothetical protein